MYHKTHVVGIFSAVERFYLHALPRRYDQGSLARELARAAGARLRELPSTHTGVEVLHLTLRELLSAAV